MPRYGPSRHPDPTYWAALKIEKFEIRAEKGCGACLNRDPHVTVWGRPLCRIEESPTARGYCDKWRFDKEAGCEHE